jgi:DNA-binding transcriptional ArsR family regulator
MDVFGAIADPVRRDLLRALATGTSRVVDLASGRPISRPAVSKHLRVLSDAGLVAADDLGRERHYRVVPGSLDSVAGFLTELATAGPAEPRPHVSAAHFAALDLEVRRTGRDRRAAEGPESLPNPSRATGETA